MGLPIDHWIIIMKNRYALLKIYGNQIWLTLLIAYPILSGQILDALNMFSSTYFIANLSETVLATFGLVISILFLFSGLCWGFLTAGGIVIAHQYGAKNSLAIQRTLHQMLIIGSVMSVVLTICFWMVPNAFSWVGMDPELVAMSRPFCRILAATIWVHTMAYVLYQLIVSTGKTSILFWVSLVEVGVGVTFKYGLVNGVWGLPKLGLLGLGLAIFISNIVFTLLFFIYVYFRKDLKQYLFGVKQRIWVYSEVRAFFHLGWPIALSFFTEFGLFSMKALLVGLLSKEMLAADQIALQYLGLFGMIGFGFSQAASARVGQALGARKYQRAALAGISSLLLGFMTMTVVMIGIQCNPKVLLAIDLGDLSRQSRELVKMGEVFLRYASIFLIIDNLRLIMVGILRAYKDTMHPLYVSLVCFWLIGQPIGYILAFPLGYQVQGLWAGLILGALCSTLALMQRLRKRMFNTSPYLQHGKQHHHILR